MLVNDKLQVNIPTRNFKYNNQTNSQITLKKMKL